MKLTKTKGKRTHVTLMDGETRRTVGITVYDVTPRQMRKVIERIALESSYSASNDRDSKAGTDSVKLDAALQPGN